MVRGRPKQRAKAAPDPQLRLRKAVDEVTPRLRQVQSAVIVAVAALRRQNCELDADIASLLQRCVCDSLHDQLAKLEAARHPSAARMPRV